MARTRILITAMFLACAVVAAQPKTQLRPEAVAAYEKYAARVERNLDQRLSGDAALFLSASSQAGERDRLRAGSIDPQFTERSLDAPGGLIQDWTATMFVKGAADEDVLALLTNYDHHQDLYPEVIASKLVSRDGTRFLQ
jgi:hypothetical protein